MKVVEGNEVSVCGSSLENLPQAKNKVKPDPSWQNAVDGGMMVG